MKVTGVGRDAEHPKCLIVYYDGVPTDDELRVLHEQLRDEQTDKLAMMVGRLAHLLEHAHPARKQAIELLAKYGYTFKPHCR